MITVVMLAPECAERAFNSPRLMGAGRSFGGLQLFADCVTKDQHVWHPTRHNHGSKRFPAIRARSTFDFRSGSAGKDHTHVDDQRDIGEQIRQPVAGPHKKQHAAKRRCRDLRPRQCCSWPSSGPNGAFFDEGSKTEARPCPLSRRPDWSILDREVAGDDPRPAGGSRFGWGRADDFVIQHDGKRRGRCFSAV